MPYSELSVDQLAAHPVKLGFEFEFASAQSHERIGEDCRGIFGSRSVGVVTSSYGAQHGGDYSKWAITGDSSINTEDGHPYKVELVSPILTPANYESNLDKVFEYLNRTRARTNSSTGMHITVSHPQVSADFTNFDIVKFALLLDDIGMTLKFRGTLTNHYTVSTLHNWAKTARTAILNKRFETNGFRLPYSGDPELLFLLTSKEPAIRACVHSMEKYRSIHLGKARNHLVEVRSPGGDWLGKGVDEAKACARTILSSLVYAVSPELAHDEYRRRFMDFFEKSVRPRPRPVVHDSPNETSFDMDDFHVVIKFSVWESEEDIDGWDIRRRVALYVESVRFETPLRSSVPLGGLFSNTARSQPFRLTINYTSRTPRSALVPEELDRSLRDDRRSERELPGLVSPSGIECNPRLRELNHVYTDSLEALNAKINTMIHHGSVFWLRASSKVAEALRQSVPNSGVQRIVTWMCGTETGLDMILRDTNIEGEIRRLREMRDRVREQSHTLASAADFGAALNARMSNLRTSRGSAAPRPMVTAEELSAFRQATPAEVDQVARPISSLMDRNTRAAPAPAPTTTEVADVDALLRVESPFHRITRSILTMQASPEAASAVSSSARAIIAPHGSEQAVNAVTSDLVSLTALTDAHPSVIRALGVMMRSSPRLRRTVESEFAASVQSLAMPMRENAFEAAELRPIVAGYFNVFMRTVDLINRVRAIEIGDDMQTFSAALVTFIGHVGRLIESVDGMTTRRGSVPTRDVRFMASLVRELANTLRIPEETVLQILHTNQHVGHLLRPTHLGRIRAELRRMTDASEQVNPCAEVILASAPEQESAVPFSPPRPAEPTFVRPDWLPDTLTAEQAEQLRQRGGFTGLLGGRPIRRSHDVMSAPVPWESNPPRNLPPFNSSAQVITPSAPEPPLVPVTENQRASISSARSRLQDLFENFSDEDLDEDDEHFTEMARERAVLRHTAEHIHHIDRDDDWLNNIRNEDE